LAKAGKRVLVLEKGSVVGGRAGSIRHFGHVLDDGAHIPSRAGHLEAVFSDLGIPYPEQVPINRSEIYHEGRWKSPKELFTAEMYKKALDEMTRLSPEEVRRLDDVPLNEWVATISDDPGIRLLFFYFGCATSVGNRFETYSAGEMIYILREILQAGRKLSEIGGVIRGGMNSLLRPLAAYVESHGGQLRLNVKVEGLRIRDGHVNGVLVEKGERLFAGEILDVDLLEAGHVIVTLPLWEIFTLLDAAGFPSWWVDWVRWIGGKVSHAWSIIYGLEEPLFDAHTFRWAPRMPRSGLSALFYPMPSYGDAVHQFQFHTSYQGHYDEMPDLLNRRDARVRRSSREIIAMLEEETMQMYPQLKGNFAWRVAHAGVYGIAQSPGLVGDKRPSMRPPGVSNLYIVSNTVREARGISLSAVGRCARLAAEAVLGS
jgi:phytoene dehydrogenase-like protein